MKTNLTGPVIKIYYKKLKLRESRGVFLKPPRRRAHRAGGRIRTRPRPAWRGKAPARLPARRDGPLPRSGNRTHPGRAADRRRGW